MIELGKIQSLIIKKTVDFGVYLGEIEGEETVLLPRKQVPADSRLNDSLEVFIYRDSEDRKIATVHFPLLTFNQVAALKVKQTTKIGAFLDWGLEKDLFLPYKEQTYKVKEGDLIPVTLYIDKSDRLCASMKIYRYLSCNPDFKADDTVEGFVYEISDSFGAFVAVDYKYSALIPKKELLGDIKAGQIVNARITQVLPDGKLNLSLREKAYIQMDKNAEFIYERLSENGGFLPLHDKSEPELIRKELLMSKNDFKRAIGRLFKQRRILIGEDGIRLV